MLMRLSRTNCSMPHSLMKPWPPKTCMHELVAMWPLSVMKALTMGVSSATSSPLSLRTFSSGWLCSLSSSSVQKICSARPPSAYALAVSSILRTSGCTMMGSASLSLAFTPESERIWMRSLA
ncbi:hypothetical protein D3C71_1525750 [compost metagenome]